MCVCACARMWLFTQGPLENAARVSEACRPAHEVKGFRVPHNSPLSIVHRESEHFRAKQWLVRSKARGGNDLPTGTTVKRKIR